MLTVLHVINSLDVGGAEMMLFKLVRCHQKRGIESVVLSLGAGGAIEDRLKELGVPVYSLGLSRKRIPNILGFTKIAKLVKKISPDIIQGWMYHGNIAATCIKRLLANESSLFWNVRHSLHDISREKRLTRHIIKSAILMRSMPSSIAYNSRISADQHESIGYPSEKTVVIPNGFDLDEYRMNQNERDEYRRYYGIDDDVTVIGHISRFHPMKNHIGMLHLAKDVIESKDDVIFVFVGRGINNSNKQLADVIGRLGIENKVRLLGEREDIPKILSSLDMLVQTSLWGEAFPNIIGEAMATGVPCVATNVGDTAWVIGEFGVIVEPDDLRGLTNGILEIIGQDKKRKKVLSAEMRGRVEKLFSIDVIADQYENLYERSGELGGLDVTR